MDQSIIGYSTKATGYGEVEPINEDKLQAAFRAIAMRNRVEQAYKSLQPNGRTDAALAGLQYGASDHDVALSAFIMQADPKVLEDVRREYALQQAPLLANKNNRDNYMNGDADLMRRGELDAAARFERQFVQARSGEEPTPNATDTLRIARDESPSQVHRNPPVSTTKKPPEPPPRSAKPSNHKPAEGPLRGTNATLSEKKPDRIVNGNAPAFGGVKNATGGVTPEQKPLNAHAVPLKPVDVANTGNGPVADGASVVQKPIVQRNVGGPAKALVQGPAMRNGGRIQNTGDSLGTSFAQKPQLPSPVSRTPNHVLAESALTKPKEPSKVQQLAHQFNKRIV